MPGLLGSVGHGQSMGKGPEDLEAACCDSTRGPREDGSDQKPRQTSEPHGGRQWEVGPIPVLEIRVPVASCEASRKQRGAW